MPSTIKFAVPADEVNHCFGASCHPANPCGSEEKYASPASVCHCWVKVSRLSACVLLETENIIILPPLFWRSHADLTFTESTWQMPAFATVMTGSAVVVFPIAYAYYNPDHVSHSLNRYFETRSHTALWATLIGTRALGSSASIAKRADPVTLQRLFDASAKDDNSKLTKATGRTIMKLSGTDDLKEKLVQNGALSSLRAYSRFEETNAIIAVSNLAGNDTTQTAILDDEHWFNTLVGKSKQPLDDGECLTGTRHAVWALAQMANGDDSTRARLNTADLTQTFLSHVKTIGDTDILRDSVWALGNLTSSVESAAEAVAHDKVALSRLLDLSKGTDKDLKRDAVYTFKNLVLAGFEKQLLKVPELWAHLISLMTSVDEEIRFDATEAVSRILESARPKKRGKELLYKAREAAIWILLTEEVDDERDLVLNAGKIVLSLIHLKNLEPTEECCAMVLRLLHHDDPEVQTIGSRLVSQLTKRGIMCQVVGVEKVAKALEGLLQSSAENEDFQHASETLEKSMSMKASCHDEEHK